MPLSHRSRDLFRAANSAQLATLQERMKTLDPFALAQAIDRKLERIEALATRRLSPRAGMRGSVKFSMTRKLNPELHP